MLLWLLYSSWWCLNSGHCSETCPETAQRNISIAGEGEMTCTFVISLWLCFYSCTILIILVSSQTATGQRETERKRDWCYYRYMSLSSLTIPNPEGRVNMVPFLQPQQHECTPTIGVSGRSLINPQSKEAISLVEPLREKGLLGVVLPNLKSEGLPKCKFFQVKVHRLCRVLKPVHKVYLDWLSNSHDNCCRCNLRLLPVINWTQPVSSGHQETNLFWSLSQYDSFRKFWRYFTCGKQPMTNILFETYQSLALLAFSCFCHIQN